MTPAILRRPLTILLILSLLLGAGGSAAAQRQRSPRDGAANLIPTPLAVVELVRLDRTGMLWFSGYRFEGERRINSIGYVDVRGAEVIDIPQPVRDFVFSLNNRLWFIAEKGLFRLNDNGTAELIFGTSEDRLMQLKLGPDESLYSYSNWRHQILRLDPIAAAIDWLPAFTNAYVTNLDISDAGVIWFSTFDNKAGRREVNGSTVFTELEREPEPGRTQNALTGISADPRGGAWITMRGERSSGFTVPSPLLLHVGSNGVVDHRSRRPHSPFKPSARCDGGVVFIEQMGDVADPPRSRLVLVDSSGAEIVLLTEMLHEAPFRYFRYNDFVLNDSSIFIATQTGILHVRVTAAVDHQCGDRRLTNDPQRRPS